MSDNGLTFVKSLVPVVLMSISMLATIVAGAYWMAHQEDRIAALESGQSMQDRRIDRIDDLGTRGAITKMVIIEERQNVVLRRLDAIEQKLNGR